MVSQSVENDHQHDIHLFVKHKKLLTQLVFIYPIRKRGEIFSPLFAELVYFIKTNRIFRYNQPSFQWFAQRGGQRKRLYLC